MYREKEIKKGNLQNDDDDDVCYPHTTALYFQILFQLLLFYFIFFVFLGHFDSFDRRGWFISSSVNIWAAERSIRRDGTVVIHHSGLHSF